MAVERAAARGERWRGGAPAGSAAVAGAVGSYLWPGRSHARSVTVAGAHVSIAKVARGRFDDTSDDPEDADGDDAPTGAHHYLGPTFLSQHGPTFFSPGAYPRLDNIADSAKVGDQAAPRRLRSLDGTAT